MDDNTTLRIKTPEGEWIAAVDDFRVDIDFTEVANSIREEKEREIVVETDALYRRVEHSDEMWQVVE